MAVLTLENSSLSLAISTLGAEMQSLKILPLGREVLWQGDLDIWPRRAPWLFPIVGKLFDDQYKVDGKTYSLKQHGFARDSEFDVVSVKDEEICFRLKANDKTLAVYPYEFSLEISYKLVENAVKVQVRVQNLGNGLLPFSFGAHPGFISSPQGVVKTAKMESEVWQFADGRTPDLNPPVPCNSDSFKLNEDLKDQMAVVFKKSQSKSLEYLHSDFKLQLDFADWPHFALWSKKQSHFICLEPWCGLPQILEGRQAPLPPPVFEYFIEKDWQRELVFRFFPVQKP